jgi:hypothetical protein
LLAEDDRLLRRDRARAVHNVGPPVAKVAQPGHLTAVVPAHVSPELASPVMTEPTVQLDVECVFSNHDIEILNAFIGATNLTVARR